MTEENKNPDTEMIKILVRANSSRNAVEGLFNDRIKIRIASAPQKGKANKALIDFIASKTGIPKSFIKIVSGEKSSFKTISVKKINSVSVSHLLLEYG